MQNLQNLNMFLRANDGQSPYEKLMSDNPRPSSAFYDQSADHSAEQNSIFARHSPEMGPRGDRNGSNVPSLLNPYEDTYEFMQNRAGSYGYHPHNNYYGNRENSDYRQGWHNHRDLHRSKYQNRV